MQTIKAKTYLEAMPSEELLEKTGYTVQEVKDSGKALKTPYFVETVTELDFNDEWEGMTEDDRKDLGKKSFVINTQGNMRDTVKANLGLVKLGASKTMAFASAKKATVEALTNAGLSEEDIATVVEQLKAQYGITE